VVSELQELSSMERQHLFDLTETVRQLAESLPQQVGQNAAASMGALLAPRFEDLARSLRELSHAGGQAIGETLQQNVGAQVSDLRGSLEGLTQLLQRLPEQMDRQVTQGNERIQQGAQDAAAALADAGRRSSDEFRAAAVELGGVGRDLQVAIEAVREASRETQEIAATLRGAGKDVAIGLSGVAAPLQVLPPTLHAAEAAIGAASRELANATDDMAASVRASTNVTDAERAKLVELLGRVEALAGAVDSVRSACDATVTSMASTTDGQRAASSDALTRLASTVESFERSLERARQDVETASRSTFASAEAVTLEASRRVAESLSAGATEFEGAMARLEGYATGMERSMEAARRIADALTTHAETIEQGISGAAVPLREVTRALEGVAPNVREATKAMETERAALGSLGSQLALQATNVHEQSKALDARMAEFRRLHELMGTEWASHVGGIERVLTQLQRGWAAANDAASRGLQSNSQQIATYAQEVEKALRLPTDIRRLDETLRDLADAIDDLVKRMPDR
jgi:ABC-type transporter Mla subunit MlaD